VFVAQWGTEGDGPGQFEEPYAVAIDEKNQLYVTDFRESRFQVFDSSGKLLARIGDHGNDPGEFDEPSGIALDGVGNVFVCDTDNNRIQKFAPA
jgi:DNA-binding beta-propeller fold protein YncE